MLRTASHSVKNSGEIRQTLIFLLSRWPALSTWVLQCKLGQTLFVTLFVTLFETLFAILFVILFVTLFLVFPFSTFGNLIGCSMPACFCKFERYESITACFLHMHKVVNLNTIDCLCIFLYHTFPPAKQAKNIYIFSKCNIPTHSVLSPGLFSTFSVFSIFSSAFSPVSLASFLISPLISPCVTKSKIAKPWLDASLPVK